jgi:hypothetical protein
MPACGEPTRRWLFIVTRNVAIDAVRMKKARPRFVTFGVASTSQVPGRRGNRWSGGGGALRSRVRAGITDRPDAFRRARS